MSRNSLDPAQASSWFEIHADNTMVLRTGKVDFGQTTAHTAYKQIVAEELNVPFEAIIGLGKKNWDAKGLATVRYQIGGKQRQFVIDDYKFDPDPTRKIFAEIEERLKGPTPTEPQSS